MTDAIGSHKVFAAHGKLWRVERLTPKHIVASRMDAPNMVSRFNRESGALIGNGFIRLTTERDAVKYAAKVLAREKYVRGFLLHSIIHSIVGQPAFGQTRDNTKLAKELTIADIREVKRACRVIASIVRRPEVGDER